MTEREITDHKRAVDAKQMSATADRFRQETAPTFATSEPRDSQLVLAKQRHEPPNGVLDFSPPIFPAEKNEHRSAVDRTVNLNSSDRTNPAISKELERKLEKVISHAIDEHGPGAAVAIMKDGRIIYQHARGQADLKNGVPLRTDHIFELASVSKQFTAMAVMMLAERGKLDLNDDIHKYLPELKTNHKITIAQLMNMTAGLPDYASSKEFDPQKATNADVLKFVNERGMKTLPGERFDYSNSNYVLLSMIAERASGMSFGKLLQDTIFNRIGMKSTTLLTGPEQVIADRVHGYPNQQTGAKAVNGDTKLSGDGQIMTNLADMARWDRELAHPSLVTASTLAKAFESGKLSNGKTSEYGFGWFVGGDGKNKFVNHTGSWTGTSTFIQRDISSGYTVVVLSNNEDFNAMALGKKLLRLVE